MQHQKGNNTSLDMLSLASQKQKNKQISNKYESFSKNKTNKKKSLAKLFGQRV